MKRTINGLANAEVPQLIAKIAIGTDRRANHFALGDFLRILRQSIVAIS